MNWNWNERHNEDTAVKPEWLQNKNGLATKFSSELVVLIEWTLAPNKKNALLLFFHPFSSIQNEIYQRAKVHRQYYVIEFCALFFYSPWKSTAYRISINIINFTENNYNTCRNKKRKREKSDNGYEMKGYIKLRDKRRETWNTIYQFSANE